MARTEEGAALTQAHRAAQLRLLGDLGTVLASGWGDVDPTDLRGTLDPWAVHASLQVILGRRVSARTARSYLIAFRRAEGVPGAFFPELVADPTSDEVRAVTFGASIRGIVDARRRGASTGEAKARALSIVSGAAIRMVADGGRKTILQAVARDREALGYQRVTDSDPCPFCRMLASRGIVGYTADTAFFKSHDHCGCTAEVAYDGSELRPENALFKEQWQAATRGKTDALKAFRQYLDEGGRDA